MDDKQITEQELQEQQFWAESDLAFVERWEADNYDVGCEFDD